MRLLSLSLLASLACATEPLEAQSRRGEPACAPLPVDSVRFGSAAVFASCEVSRPARLRRAPLPMPSYPDGILCLVATVEFVVDDQGTPVLATARIIEASTPAFAAHVLAALPGWEYAPALRGRLAVSSLVTRRVAVKSVGGRKVPFVAVEPGQRPPPPPPPPPPCR